MTHPRRPAVLAAVGALVVTGGTLLAAGLPAGASTDAQSQSAAYAGGFLARQVTSGGFVPDLASADASPSRTLRAALGLATSGHGRAAFTRAVGYLEGHVAATTTDSNGAVRPGATGLLAITAVAAGRDPRAFGGTASQNNLVERILSTQVTASGPTQGQLTDPAKTGYPGTFTHSLALLGLAAARAPQGDSRVQSAITYLRNQQCADGGFQNSARGSAACTPTDEDADTSGYAVQALAAYDVRSAEAPALGYFRASQNADGGYGNFGTPAGSNSDSTGVVGTALSAIGTDPDDSSLAKGGVTPAGFLRRVQKPRSADPLDGAYGYDGDPADDFDLVLGTQEAMAGQLGVTLPMTRVALTDDEPRQPAPAPSMTPTTAPGGSPPASPSPAPPTTTPSPTAAVVRPACATVVTPTGRRTAVPTGCLPAPAAMTPCTVILAKVTFRKSVIPAGCLPLPATQTPCSTVVDRHGRKGVLPRRCLPLFASAKTG